METPKIAPNEPKLTLWQRLMADTPVFWKKVELIGLILGGGTATIAANLPPPISPQIKLFMAVAAGISAGMVGLGKVAVKNPTVLENPNVSLQDVVDAIPALKQQLTDLHGTVITTVNDALTKGKIDTPAADIPVVTDQTKPVTAAEAIPVVEEALSSSEIDTNSDEFKKAVQDAVNARIRQQNPQ